jgi:predicted esterase
MTEQALSSHLAEHNPINRLAPLAQARVPILHIHGNVDTVVPLERNSGLLAQRYRQLGGDMQLIVVPGRGHQVCPEFFHCQTLVDFVIAHAK